MTTWAIVPVKPFNRSKSRLSGVLDGDEREALSRGMLEHTLSTLAECDDVQGVLVVSRDSSVLAIARDHAANTVLESGSPELNAALTRASQVVAARGAQRVLVLPSDLPLVTPEDIRGVLHNGVTLSEVVVAPDRREDGTNALVVKPPGLFEFGFGKDSFARHLKRAAAAGATPREFRSPTLALDVDVPEDLALYHELVATG